MSMSLRENITAVIETCFSETKDEIQDTAINRILELIRADRKDEPQVVDWKDEMWTEAREQLEKCLADKTEPKQGEWIDIWEDGRSTKAVCNTCGRVSDRPLGDFCKWCGVTMKGADE